MESIGKMSNNDEVFVDYNPLDEQVEQFQKVGARYALPSDVVDIRLEGLSTEGTRTAIMPVTFKAGPTYLVKPSIFTQDPLLAKLAVKAHGNARHATLHKDYFEIVKEEAKSQEGLEPEDRSIIELSRGGDYGITQEMPEARFIQGPRTAEYFERFVKSDSIPIWGLETDNDCETTANYLWFDSPDDESGLNLRGWYLGYDYRAFGVVLPPISVADAKNSEGYNLTTIRNANSESIIKVLEEKDLSGLNNTLSKPLIEGLLNKLREQ